MASEQSRFGHVAGTGAAIDVKLGWIPDKVEVANMTDGTRVDVWYRGKWMPFSSGGTNEIKVGDVIHGAGSKAYATVAEVFLTGGSWAGGDAAGFFRIDEDSIYGTFTSENVGLVQGDNDATVTAIVEYTYKIDTQAAPITTNGIKSLPGVAGTAEAGFTIGSAVSTAGKILKWTAHRNGPGA